MTSGVRISTLTNRQLAWIDRARMAAISYLARYHRVLIDDTTLVSTAFHVCHDAKKAMEQTHLQW
eukprot:SAG31_NODE_2788_length_5089_cov_7.201002_1_plen_65_part_00